MSFFNNIEKIIYHNSKDEVVSLSEYIIFEDEKLKEKFIIFKFQNNVNQILKRIRFEVSQFDENGNLVETSVLDYKGFEANGNDNFVPNAKFKANAECKTVKVTTLYALFERVEWKNNEFIPVEYSVDDFRKDFTKKTKTTEKPVKKAKKEKKISARKQAKLDKRTIVIKNVTKKNLTVSPKVWTIIFSIVLFAFLILTSVMYMGDSKQFYDNGFEYTLTGNGSEVIISDYDNKDSDVVIPEVVNELKVVGIGEHAFENCTINSVQFTTAIPVERYAFSNCKNLKTIKGANFISTIGEYAFRNCTSLSMVEFGTANYVGMGAFEGCTSLNEVILPVAILLPNAFKGCTALNLVDCLGTDGQFYTVFGNPEDVIASLKTIRIGKDRFESGYFQYMSSVENLEIKSADPVFEYGSLIGISAFNYEYNETMEVLDGEVISVKDYSALHFPASVSDIEKEIEKMGSNTYSVRELKISKANGTITQEMMSNFPNLNTLYYVKGVPYAQNAFEGNSNLTTLKLSTDDNHFGGINMLLPNVTDLIIEGNKNIYASMFEYNTFSFNQITTVSINNTVKGVNKGALSSLNNVRNLYIPNFSNSTLNNMGVSLTLENLSLTDYEQNKMLNENYINGYHSLYNINLPTNVEVIGNNFISNCDSITYLTLPQSVKEIKGKLVSNCDNLMNLYLNEGLEVIGDSLIYNAPRLQELIIPTTVTTVGKNLVSNCSELYILSIPSATKLGLPLIGNGVYLKELNVPFVGGTVDKPVKFSVFNESYKTTAVVKIANGFNAVSNMFAGCDNLAIFECAGEINNISKGFFGDCYNLTNVEISGSFNDKLTDLFNVKSKSFKYLVISSKELRTDFFDACSFGILMVKQLNVVLKEQFSGMSFCEYMFLTLNNERNVLDYSTLSGKVYMFYTDCTLPDDIYSYGIPATGNYAQEYFYNDYIANLR